MIAMFDQLQSNLRDLAPVLYAYLDRLMAAGFTREEAMDLVKEMQSSIVREDAKG